MSRLFRPPILPGNNPGTSCSRADSTRVLTPGVIDAIVRLTSAGQVPPPADAPCRLRNVMNTCFQTPNLKAPPPRTHVICYQRVEGDPGRLRKRNARLSRQHDGMWRLPGAGQTGIRGDSRWDIVLSIGLRRQLPREGRGSVHELAKHVDLNRSYTTRFLRLSWLSPEITHAILWGHRPAASSGCCVADAPPGPKR
jgi:hypothetical protein